MKHLRLEDRTWHLHANPDPHNSTLTIGCST